jgi:hypothetical protein
MIDEFVWNITSGNDLRHDLKAELFLILMEMSEAKIIKAHKDGWLHYLCINILKKQWKSKTSPFFKKFRNNKTNEIVGDVVEDLDFFDYELLDKILEIVEKLPFVERELFKMRYKIGKYDRWFGEWRDESCKKAVYPYRKIEKKLAITDINGNGVITIDHSTVEKYHKKSIVKIKKILDKNDTK